MKKIDLKKIKPLLLLILLLASAGLLTAAGYAGRDTVYASYTKDSPLTPELSLVFQGWKDGIFPWEAFMGEDRDDTSEQAVIAVPGYLGDGQAAEAGAMVEGTGLSPDDPDSADHPDKELLTAISGNQVSDNQITEEPVSGSLIPDIQISGNSVSSNDLQNGEIANTQSPENDGEGQQTYSFTQVGEEYFDDALFIGDSRTVGLFEYGGIEDRATFYAETSLSIWDVFDKPKKIAKVDGEKMTVAEALTIQKFSKIYIMLGINELGRGTVASFFTEYANVVNQIRMLQPDAVIFIQGIMRVAAEKNSTDPTFNNTNINERNAAIAMMADNQTIFYLDVNEAVCGEDGNLVTDYTFDQVHLKAKYYQLWKEYLLTHAIVRE